jgi:uncharacterized membrane protein
MAARKVGRKTETAEGSERNQPGTGRIEAFSDGVIAIIITIMVLNLRLPEDGAVERGLWDGIARPLLPHLTTYALSFLVVGIFWVHHHQLMPTAPIATRPLMWWNNLLLFCMSLIPFATRFLGEHPFLPAALAFYGFVLFACCAAFLLLRLHIARVAKNPAAVDAYHNRALRKTIVGAALYALSVPLAYLSAYAAVACLLAVPVIFFLPEALPKKLPDEME